MEKWEGKKWEKRRKGKENGKKIELTFQTNEAYKIAIIEIAGYIDAGIDRSLQKFTFMLSSDSAQERRIFKTKETGNEKAHSVILLTYG